MSIRLRQAFVRAARAKTVFALLFVALGLSLGTAVCTLSFAHLVVFEPLPYPEQTRLVIAEQVIFDQRESAQSRDYSYPAVALLHESAGDVFSSSVMMDMARDIVVSHSAQPLVNVNYVAGEYAKLFAPPMALGQFFSTNTDVGGDRPVAVISFSAWQSLFGARSDVLGKSLRTASGVDFQVVGVTARDFGEPEFNGPGHRTSVWLPWKFNPSPAHWGWGATTDTLTFAARLAPGVSKRQAAERLSLLLGARWRAELGTTAGAHAGWSSQVAVISAQRAIAGDGIDVGVLMLSSALGLILVVLVNIIHLLVAKVAERAREFSIQLALGARRAQLFVLVLADMLVLMLPAAVLALVVVAAGFAAMQRYLQGLLPRIEELSVGLWTVALMLGSSGVLAVLFAGVALASCGQPTANGALNVGRNKMASKVSCRLRTVLMASQVGVAGLLIAVNVGLLREATVVLSEPGIDLARSASAFLYQSPSASQNRVSPGHPFAEVRRRLLHLPGVEQLSQSHSPLQDFIKTAVVSTRSGAQFPVDLKRIDHDYLGITGQRLALGRNFSAADVEGAANVVLINSTLAMLLRQGGSVAGEVLGTPLRRGEEAPYIVVGIVDELAYPGASASGARIYLPASQAGSNFIIKFRPGYWLTREQLVALVTGVNPGFGVFLYDDLSWQRWDILLSRRITATAAALVALVVIFVSGIGLFGMVSYTTRLRRSEIGARLAFGARPRHIVLMLLKSIFAALAIGCAASAAFALLVLPELALNTHLAGVRGIDASLALGILGLLAIIACYLSAGSILSQAPAAALGQ